jgi:uncharacterized protein (DUF362 family)
MSELERPKVAIRYGGSPSQMARDALSEAVHVSIRGKKVLVKPNLGFKGTPSSGIVTHPEVVLGVIQWAKDEGAGEITIGDSCIYGVDFAEAISASGILEVVKREGVKAVHLDQAKPVKLTVPDPYILESFQVSSIALEADVIISVPVIKSHMHTGATLSLKNMKGVLFQKEKMRMHHLAEKRKFHNWSSWKTLDRAIADLTSAILPQIVLLDGIVVMEGMGPLIGDAKPLGAIVASQDALAADIVGLELIGFTKEDAPHIQLVGIKQGRPDLSLDQIELSRETLSRIKTPISRAVPQNISSSYPYFMVTNKDACSACDSTVMAFLKTFGKQYEGKEEVQILFGNSICGEDIKLAHCIFLGNCTGRHKKKGTFLPGCPPVPSDIKRALE